MNHLSEEDLILHYYGEGDDALSTAHRLDECEECRERFEALARALDGANALEIPERDAAYGERVWLRIQDRLPARRPWFQLPQWRWAVAGVAFAGLLVAAFLAGRSYPGARSQALTAADRQQRQSVLLVAVGDYLERSQMVLVELANAEPSKTLDITSEQERAGDLVSEARLYRQTAAHTGDQAVAGVLDELERVLVDITHEPAQLSPARLEQLRERLRGQGILFKMRVLGKTVQGEQQPAAGSRAL
jgi:hypothetical protein